MDGAASIAGRERLEGAAKPPSASSAFLQTRSPVKISYYFCCTTANVHVSRSCIISAAEARWFAEECCECPVVYSDPSVVSIAPTRRIPDCTCHASHPKSLPPRHVHTHKHICISHADTAATYGCRSGNSNFPDMTANDIEPPDTVESERERIGGKKEREPDSFTAYSKGE